MPGEKMIFVQIFLSPVLMCLHKAPLGFQNLAVEIISLRKGCKNPCRRVRAYPAAGESNYCIASAGENHVCVFHHPLFCFLLFCGQRLFLQR